MYSTLRLRKKPLLDVVQRLDAFEKVQDTVREEKKFSGGLIFLLCTGFATWLVINEFAYYTSTRFDYQFNVDTEFDKKLHIEIDIVVSMPCHSIGADVMDATERPLAFAENQLRMDPVDFELTETQRQYWNVIRHLKRNNLPGQPGLQDLMFVASDFMDNDENESSTSADVVEPSETDGDNDDVLVIQLDGGGTWQRISMNGNGRKSQKRACRVHGFIKLNKVNGNLHITPGKSLPIVGGGHLHISQMGGPVYNFSHRIQKLAFGPPVPGLMNPLDGTEEISEDPFQMYQYYAQIVPTKVHSQIFAPVDTCQYSISKRHRTIDHSRGSHGMPGIYIKYEMNPIKVDIYETHRSYMEFAIRLCAIVGGVFATSGLVNMLISGLYNLVCRRRAVKRSSSSTSLYAKPSVSNGSDTAGSHQSSIQEPSDRVYGQAFIT